MATFFDKGCARCHSVLGEGGRSAPDLARAPGGHLSSAELLAAMWNHAPAMWEKMRLEEVQPPAFSEQEMTNLFAFLYSVRSLDEPGDAERGRRLLTEKNCGQCHSLQGKGQGIGPDLRQWAAYRNPVSWAQAMWNHAPTMQEMMAARGLRWPELHGSDLSDLVAYIRRATPGAKPGMYLQPADPQSGRRLFHEKGCAGCHAAGKAPDLRSRKLPRTLGQFATAMWNHAPAMRASMRERKVKPPQLSASEMADLLAYLFAQRYFDRAGNATVGARLFHEKGCSTCHESPATTGAPDLRGHPGLASPVHMAASLWNHGPVMLRSMREQAIAWPHFQPGEMADLIAFLEQHSRKPAGGR